MVYLYQPAHYAHAAGNILFRCALCAPAQTDEAYIGCFGCSSSFAPAPWKHFRGACSEPRLWAMAARCRPTTFAVRSVSESSVCHHGSRSRGPYRNCCVVGVVPFCSSARSIPRRTQHHDLRCNRACRCLFWIQKFNFWVLGFLGSSLLSI